MVKVTYVQPDGTAETHDIDKGASVMEGAVRNGVAGIDADCGGACSCATCHVKIMRDWMALVGPPSEMENDMLEAAPDFDERSRLSCQVHLNEALDGLVVDIPASQR